MKFEPKQELEDRTRSERSEIPEPKIYQMPLNILQMMTISQLG